MQEYTINTKDKFKNNRITLVLQINIHQGKVILNHE